MGTDIHVVAQVRSASGAWEDCDGLPENVENRNYTWFTFLDGCREQNTNGDRKLGIIPMPRRGRPEDFEVKEPPPGSYDVDCYHGEKWMGYGPCGWATLRQIIDHAKIQPALDHRVGPIEELEAFFEGRDPDDCRIVWGYDS